MTSLIRSSSCSSSGQSPAFTARGMSNIALAFSEASCVTVFGENFYFVWREWRRLVWRHSCGIHSVNFFFRLASLTICLFTPARRHTGSERRFLETQANRPPGSQRRLPAPRTGGVGCPTPRARPPPIQKLTTATSATQSGRLLQKRTARSAFSTERSHRCTDA